MSRYQLIKKPELIDTSAIANGHDWSNKANDWFNEIYFGACLNCGEAFDFENRYDECKKAEEK